MHFYRSESFPEQLRRAAWMLGVLIAVTLAPAPRIAQAYSPEHPVVKAMVERGIQHIEDHFQDSNKRSTMSEGGIMLAAYAHHKVESDPANPVVQAGLAVARERVESVRRTNGLRHSAEITYECSVALLLMIDVDPKGMASEIQYLGNALIATQKPHGGFGYLNEQKGDISQTQYCVLAMWTMDQADFDVPKASMGRAVEYLLRVQDPSGRFGYKGNDSGAIGRRVAQDNMQSHSLTTAGAGSILIGGDFFGFWRSGKAMKPEIEGLPPALEEVEDVEEMRRRRETFQVPDDTLLEYVNLTERFMQTTPYRMPNGRSWHYYYIYTLERYKSFLEVARGAQEKEPAWYNEVVEMLRAKQDGDGGWGNYDTDRQNTDASISTSFAVLFLIRSTKKAIGDIGEGLLAGGYGLPDDLTNIRVEGTQIKPPASQVAVNDLLGLLEKDVSGKLDGNSIPQNLKLAKDPKERKQQLARLERVIRGSESYKSRQVAMRLLAQSDELSAVPTLIYGLTDPDKTAKRYARDGLRFISRRFTGFGLSADPEPSEVNRAVDDWKDWYLQFDPGYIFIE